MIPRTKIDGFCAALLCSLVLPLACTDNLPSRVLEQRSNDTADSGSGGSAGKGSNTGGASTGGANTGGASTGGGAGAPGVDPCLPECDDPAGCELTPEEQLMVDFCRLYAKHCPDQPPDVMMERGPGTPVPAGPAAPSTATRPQLTETEADGLYSIEAALRAGGEYTASYSGGMAGAGGAAGAPGAEPLGQRTVSYASEDDWDPRGAIEDVTKIVPGLIVDPNGDPEQDGTHTTIQSAISDAVLVAGCPRVFIKVMPGTYREKITVPAKT